MIVRERPSPSGFTLVEMMVALAIFSLISVAGVTLLQSASSTQIRVKDRLSELSAHARSVAVIEADLAQAIAKPVRLSSTGSAAAFVSGGGETAGQIFAFTRTGLSNLDTAPRSDLQRIAYAFDGNALKRIGWTAADGGTPVSADLLSDVTNVTAQFRDGDGNWRSTWDATNPLALPRALELNITRKKAAPVRLLFLVGTGDAVKAAKPEGEGADVDAP